MPAASRTSPPGAERLAFATAIERLGTPFAGEDFSPLTGIGALVVDLTDGGGQTARAPGAPALAAARAALARLPAPGLALRRRGRPLAPGADALLDAFDVVVESERDLSLALEGVAQAPLAALALVQLLRLGERLDAQPALVAESLVYSTLQAGPEFRAWLRARGPATPVRATGDTDPACVRVAREGRRLEITLDRPDRHNAYSSEMRDQLAAALALAVADDSLAEIVLAGAGRSFCSGGDLDEFGTLADPATAHAVRTTRSVAALLHACRDRATARVHGACIGAGVELPAFAGRVVALADTFFQLPELSMGLVPGAGGTVSLPRRIGRQRTAWLALSGARVDAATARAWRLVDEIE